MNTIEWCLAGAGALILLGVLPARGQDDTVCAIGRFCLAMSLCCLASAPGAALLNAWMPGGLSLNALFILERLFAFALPLLLAGLSIHLGRVIRWSADALCSHHVPPASPSPRPRTS